LTIENRKSKIKNPSRRRLRPRSLRAQLALWHGGLLALTLLLLAAFTYVLLRQFLSLSADAALTDYAEKTAKLIAARLYQFETQFPGKTPDAAFESRFIDNNDLQSWGRYVQVINRNGEPVARSDALRTKTLPRLDPGRMLEGLRGETLRQTVTDLGEFPLRVVTVPVQRGSKVEYLVQAGASVEGVEGALQRASVILLVLTPSVFAVAVVGGWFLVGSALKPVDAMTQTALTIEGKRLDVRLVPPRSDNEIGRLAAALNEMIARLDKSFKQIERFTADASHELKTPLTSIRGEAEVALMSDETPEETRRVLQSIIEETERLTAIVTNLLLLSRADADQVRLKHEPIALDEVAMSSFETMERLARRKHITLDIAEMDDAPIEGDALWIQQLITNLLNNAINYTPEGGTVIMSVVRAQPESPDIPHALTVPHARLSVADTGIGIAPEHLPSLFDRFYRVDSGRSRDQGGSGLGLNIARWVAESHGGQIRVESEVGKGTTFTVLLPLRQSQVAEE
jgi:heavy metal sensor kinase